MKRQLTTNFGWSVFLSTRLLRLLMKIVTKEEVIQWYRELIFIPILLDCIPNTQPPNLNLHTPFTGLWYPFQPKIAKSNRVTPPLPPPNSY